MNYEPLLTIVNHFFSPFTMTFCPAVDHQDRGHLPLCLGQNRPATTVGTTGPQGASQGSQGATPWGKSAWEMDGFPWGFWGKTSMETNGVDILGQHVSFLFNL